MKIDIKSIVNTLASGVSEIKNTSGTVNIREALGESAEKEQSEEFAKAPDEVFESEAQSEVEEAEEQPEAEVEESEEIQGEEESGQSDEGVSEEQPEAEADEQPEVEAEEQPEAEAEEQPEAEVDERPEAEVPQEPGGEESSSKEPSGEEPAGEEPRPSAKERIIAWGRSYGWLTGIAASFVILMAFMVIYTTMTPREITATIDGKQRTFVTEEYTIEGFLSSKNIEVCEEDYLSVPLTTFIQEGLTFELEHATDFAVTADGKIKRYKSLDSTVQQALDDVGIKVGKLDIVEPAPETPLENNMRIIVRRVEIKTEVVEESVPFETKEQDDANLNEGTSKVVTEGKDGKDKVTYEVKYIDGEEAAKKELDRETITAAVDEVIANGTRVNYNGKSYSRKLVVKAYSYTGGGTTAMGTRARVGEIAVDPSVIPLGTNVYIEGVGPRRAEDTGGNIKGNTIDIYMNTRAECIRWGVRYVTIYIE